MELEIRNIEADANGPTGGAEQVAPVARPSDARAPEKPRAPRGPAGPASALAIVAACFAIAILFNGEGLVAWADSIEDPIARPIALDVAETLAWPGRVSGIATALGSARAWFLSVSRAPGEEAAWTLASAGPETASEDGSADATATTVPDADGSIVAVEASPEDDTKPPAASPVAKAPAAVAKDPGYTLGIVPDSPVSIRYRGGMGVYSAKRPIRILLLGDSMAKLGTADALLEWDKTVDWAEVYVSTKVSSSLSNPKTIDWQAQIRAVTAERAYDAVIVFLGSNDAQGIAEGRSAWAFGTSEWYSIWDRRARDFIGVIADRAWKIYWTAIPPMRKGAYGQRMNALNEHVAALLAEFPGARFVLTEKILGDDRGLYVDAKIIDGSMRVIRHTDGVHMDIWGARLLVAEYVRMILADFEIEGVTRAIEAAPISGD